MKKIMGVRKDSGITLIALVVIIIILLILTTFATYSGIKAIESTAYTKFVAELKIMQTYVNSWYEECKPKNEQETFSNNIATKFAGISTETRDGVTYYVLDEEQKETLGVEGVSQIVLVNVENRSVVSKLGLNYDGQMYYTLDELGEDYLVNHYNVDYEDKNTQNPVLNNIETTAINSTSWKISIQSAEYKGYTSFKKLKYALKGTSDWQESKDDFVVLDKPGTYKVKVEDTAGNNSNELETTVEYGYVTDDIMAYFDVENNAGNGQHNSSSTTWKNLKGNNDATLSRIDGIKDKYIEFNGQSTYAQVTNMGFVDNQSYTFEIVASFSESQISKVLMECYTNDQGGMAIGIENTQEYANKLKYHQNSYATDRINSTNALNDGKVHHIVGAYDNSTKTMYLYVDGNLDSSRTVASNITFPSTTLNIGRWATGGNNSQYFKGNIYSFRVYNKCLTQNEVNTNLKIEKARYGIK